MLLFPSVSELAQDVIPLSREYDNNTSQDKGVSCNISLFQFGIDHKYIHQPHISQV